MAERVIGRGPIAAWAVLAYLLRFLSSWAVVAWTEDAKFDPHSFGLIGDMLQLSVMAAPLLGLLIWTIRRRQPWRGLFAPASSVTWTILPFVLLVLVGAPTLGQVWAVILLPVTGSWPVLAAQRCACAPELEGQDARHQPPRLVRHRGHDQELEELECGRSWACATPMINPAGRAMCAASWTCSSMA